MRNEQRTEQATDTTPKRGSKKSSERKPIFTAENILKASKGRVSRIITAIIAVLVLIACFNEAYDYTKLAIGDGAYKYSDDSYTYIEESVKNYLGEDGPNIANLQESIPIFTAHYENGKTILVCTLQDGFFRAEVTSVISKDFQLEKSTRNFNSLSEYQEYFWHSFKHDVAMRACGIFSIIAVVWLLLSSAILLGLKKAVKKQEDKPNPELSISAVDSTPVQTFGS